MKKRINTDELKIAATFWVILLIMGTGCFLAAYFLDGLKGMWVGLGGVATIILVITFIVSWERVLD